MNYISTMATYSNWYHSARWHESDTEAWHGTTCHTVHTYTAHSSGGWCSCGRSDPICWQRPFYIDGKWATSLRVPETYLSVNLRSQSLHLWHLWVIKCLVKLYLKLLVYEQPAFAHVKGVLVLFASHFEGSLAWIDVPCFRGVLVVGPFMVGLLVRSLPSSSPSSPMTTSAEISSVEWAKKEPFTQSEITSSMMFAEIIS